MRLLLSGVRNSFTLRGANQGGHIIGEKTTHFAPVRYRGHNISEQTLYRWKKKYGNMELADAWVPYNVGRGF